MKRNLTRRDFLKLLAAGAGGLAIEQLLTGCTPAEITIPTQTSEPTLLIDDPTATHVNDNTADPRATTRPIPDLVVVRGGEPEELVRKGLEALGGMATIVPQGASVIIKPNICVAYHTFEYAATTNPWVIGGLVKACFEAGAGNVKVIDFPFGGSAEDAYTRSGIREQVEASGGEMEIMSYLKFQSTDIPAGLDLTRTEAYKDALDTDVLINVPIAKHHGSTRLSLALKNLMGLVLDRGSLHTNLGQRIADLGSLFRPELTVVDAVRILTANGPTGGDLADVTKMDTIILSRDIVAADSYATSLFGLTPMDIDYIPAAAAMGLGRMDLQNLDIQEILLS